MDSPRSTGDTPHITTIHPRDSVGHYSWSCACRGQDGDGSGYDLASDVVADATAHGPLAADSLKPVDPTDEDDAPPTRRPLRRSV
jgi:hypothetical protein